MATIGATAPSQNTINYDSLLSTTLNAYQPKLIDNIYKSSAFLAALKQYDGVKMQSGGERVQVPLMYEKNDTVKSYSGYEQLVVKPQDGITSAFYPWTEIAGTISISRREERQNNGEAALLNLLESKIMQAEMALKEAINTQLIQGTALTSTFVPGNSAKDLFPLGYFLPSDCTADPLAGGNVGNISRVSTTGYEWWRPNTANFNTTVGTGEKFGLAVTTFAGMRVGLYRMYNYCQRGADGSGPNLIVFDQISYETYENSSDVLIRYQDQSLADMGFQTIKLKGATCIWDESMPDIYTGTVANVTGSAFFLNTKFYKLYIDSQTNFVTTPFIEPENQTAKVAKVLFMGQAGVSNPRKLGCVKRIALSIVA